MPWSQNGNSTQENSAEELVNKFHIVHSAVEGAGVSGWAFPCPLWIYS